MKRGIQYLFGDIGGQIKVINTARSCLDIAEYATASDPQWKTAHENIKQANSDLGDIKALFYFAKTPQELPAYYRQYLKTKKSYLTLYRKWNQRERIENQEWLSAATHSCKLAKKTLTFAADSFFKPFKVIVKLGRLEGTAREISKAGETVSIVKSGFKICYICGKLTLGSKKAFCKTIDLILEIWEMTLNILRSQQVYVHPIAHVVFSVLKTLFSFYEIYVKTY